MVVSDDIGITAEDYIKIKELRELIQNEIPQYYDTDFNLLRWLKGYNYKIDEIVPKMKNHFIFRKSSFFSKNIANKKREHPLHQYWKSGLTTCARPNNSNVIVNIEQTGTNDFWGILQTFSLNEIMKGRIYDLELMLKAVMDLEANTGKQSSILYIMDLSGLQFHANLITLLTGPLASISTFMSEHYVELIHSFVLVGVPSFITAIWSIAKPLLPERTKNKVKILGSNWRKEILKMASADALPIFWNVEGSEKIFTAHVEESISVNPANYYNKDGKKQLENAKLLTVSSGKTGSIDFNCEKDQTIHWTFNTNGHFAYALYYSPDPSEESLENMICVYPRFNKVPGPTYVPITDSIICPFNGTYKLWFSNEHAWFHTLHIHHVTMVS